MSKGSRAAHLLIKTIKFNISYLTMRAKFRASKSKRDEKDLRDTHKSLNINKEYLGALRTKSYGEFFTKAQLLANEQPSFQTYCHHHFYESLLEPRQETIPIILDSTIISKVPELKALMLNYFDISAEASKICIDLLESINQVQYSCQFIHRALKVSDDDHSSPKKVKMIVSELKSFIILNNPFSNPNKEEFKLIHDKYSLVLDRLKFKRKRVARKIKFIKCIHKISGICFTAACGLGMLVAIVVAAHTLIALLMGPVIFSFPVKRWKNKLFKVKSSKCSFLRKVGNQLDMAAKGTYILDRDFDTMSRLVARLYDEVEHNKAMIKLCLERSRNKFYVQVMKELKKSDMGFRKQVKELEEHVYLCLVTINRARALVIKEMTAS